MNDVVRLESASKVYRLYRAPAYRFLDLFGLCPAGGGFYTEHLALDRVDLTVGSGEKVAIIGRNGAGKSTMLKVITGLVAPTSGTARVNGRISNLLQIGSGFHPDFTGRQNVFATLAHQGIVGRQASSLFDEIVAFAEIEEYIDQPMKTYSTGMCSRLMFSSAVVAAPEILIVDEILGVGDAYFAHKSFERMRELCTQDGTTLLLVTHDIYSALNLCDRFVWLDHGRVLFDGEGRPAIAMYEGSIKAQEEQRLRHANAARLAADGTAPAGDRGRVHVAVRSRTGFALAEPLALESIALTGADGSVTTLAVADGAPGWHLLPESSLGTAETVGGRPSRVLRSTGSIFHKAEWLVTLPAAAQINRARVRWHYQGSDLVDLLVFTPDRTVQIAGELGPADGWQEQTLERAGGPGTPLGPQQQTDYGTGAVRIMSVQFLDALGRDVVQARHGDPLTIRLRVSIDRALTDRHVTVIVGFRRQGAAYNGCIYERDRLLPDADACTIDLTLDPMRFGSGQWFVSVGIGKAGLYERPVVKYFATDSDWHHLLAGGLQLQILSAGGVDAVGCFVVHPATITCEPIALEAVAR
jgi:ABC-type polysaccharide/polyol phosphate transport system ATPase subunit